MSTDEALARLAQFGPNELSIQRHTGWLRTLAGVVRKPMVPLLVAFSAPYFSLGALREVLILLGSIVLVVLITLVQERKPPAALATVCWVDWCCGRASTSGPRTTPGP